MDWEAIQRALQARGYYMEMEGKPLRPDGIPGIGTRQAIKKFELDFGLPVEFPPGNRVLGRLKVDPPHPEALIAPPWMHILDAKMGLREVEDKAALEAFLASDGATLGDPSVFPWCGDLAQTVILDAGYGPVPGNPYLALNWSTWALPQRPGYGVLATFRRPGPKGNEGHVGFLVGLSVDGKLYRVRGGNESNQIGDAWIPAERLAAIRGPVHYTGSYSPLPVLNGKDAQGRPIAISTNEA